jgi:penicillin amidase
MQVRRYTPHGPVLVWDPKQHLAYSARWTAFRDDLITLDQLFGIERATSTAEVASAFATLVTPCFNVVVADVDGDVRYCPVGLLPDRAFVPDPGPIPSDGRHEWRSVVPRDRMPGWRVPPNGFAVNGNNRPAGGASPYALPRYDWPHDRARRMAQRLAGDASVTVADAMSVQNDVHSLAADRNLPSLLRCADSLSATLSPRAIQALDSLRAWDRRAVRSKVAPTLYRAWFAAFQRRSQFEGLPGLALAALDGQAPELGERPSAAACSALVMAIDTLAAKLGPDPAQWRYARAHQARFRHVLSVIDRRARWEPPLTPEDGDNATPSVGPSRLPWTVEVTHGPVFRHVVDLSRPLVSWTVVPPWNSAAFPGAGDRDLRAKWADHAYVPLHMDWAQIERVAMDHTTLTP